MRPVTPSPLRSSWSRNKTRYSEGYSLLPPASAGGVFARIQPWPPAGAPSSPGRAARNGGVWRRHRKEVFCLQPVQEKLDLRPAEGGFGRVALQTVVDEAIPGPGGLAWCERIQMNRFVCPEHSDAAYPAFMCGLVLAVLPLQFEGPCGSGDSGKWGGCWGIWGGSIRSRKNCPRCKCALRSQQ